MLKKDEVRRGASRSSLRVWVHGAAAAFFFLLMTVLPSLAGGGAAKDAGAGRQVQIFIFWDLGCPHCARALAFLERQQMEKPWLKVKAVEISSSEDGERLFGQTAQMFGITQPAVPLIITGQRYFLGFDDGDGIGAEIIAEAERCRVADCRPILLEVGDSLADARALEERQASPTVQGPGLRQSVRLPIIGEISTNALSLPVLTIVLAAVDGFNPCAMWVLIFLIGLLIGMQDRLRMWLLGGAFLLATAVVYFAFLAAWLNAFLFLGALAWIRVGVGLFALGSGVYYLREFATNAAGECKVTSPERRMRVMEGLTGVVKEKRFLVALAGIVVLAAAVNMIELLCSAGLPAVFTNVLAMSALPTWQYYLYLLLYIAVFLADDVLIFVTAMVTLHASGLTATYSRISHLIGGAGMAVIGLLLLFRPEWLTFA